MLAKIITKGATRAEALSRLEQALASTEIGGLETNLLYLRDLAASDVFAKGEMLTRTLATFPYQPKTIEVLAPGTVTTMQDYPGRLGILGRGRAAVGTHGQPVASAREPRRRQSGRCGRDSR